MQVIVDGLLTNYEMSGKGKIVLLLHGWGDQAQGLRSLQAALSKRFTVIAPDLPGFGQTASPKQPWGLNDYAQFIRTFLEKIDAARPYAIIGHSNGGALAIRAIGQQVLLVDKLVLIASSGMRDVYEGRRKALRLITKAGKAITLPLPNNIKRKLKRAVYDTIGSDMLVAEHLQETFKRVVTDDVQQDAARISVPTLLIYGENDTATPPAYGQQFHELISNSTLEILARAGHFPHIEQPNQVLAAIEEFL